MKKRIYFVRHGESELNASRIRQGREGHLSALGLVQADFVAERFLKIPVDVIISSPYVRTIETAQIIQKKIQTGIDVSELLSERRNPKEIIGKSSNDPEVAAIIDRIDKSFHTNDLRYSDEENFEDLKNRARELLRFLENRKEKVILCVTHMIFLTMVASYIEFGEKLTSRELAKLTFLNTSNNAGITLCTYSKKWLNRPKENVGWKLIVWDDYGRLDSDLKK